MVKGPNPGSFENSLSDVAAVTANDVWAVGFFSNSSTSQTLIAHWNGSSWSGATSPDAPGSVNNFLDGIAVISASDIWAVGGYQSSNLAEHTLTEHWNGSKWSIVPSP